MSSDPPINALSFDIEDWFHMVEIESVDDPRKWDAFPSIVERETEWILDTLSERKVTATFFILGWVADRYPDLVRSISDAGHEIGSHSFWHRRVDRLTPEEFRTDVKDSLDAIRAAGVRECPGFRAPTFSIVPGSEWAIDELLDLGFEYDASLFPTPREHGGYPCVREPHHSTIAPSGRSIPELPMSIMDVGPKSTAFSGGGFFRLFPRWMIKRGFTQCNAAGRPVVVYMHPRDFALGTPHVQMGRARRFKCYVGIKGARDKFRWMLDNWRFTTCSEVLASLD
ncbi:MAG: polysaccharide deacetylase family protein [Phycisphaerales bacterium]|nr:polysaccharide deacetylase family protein [Phycisphaerales bacterium]